jgi:hypothetical protein
MATSSSDVLEAAKFLDMLQKEAASRVLSAYGFEDNLVRGSVIEMQDAIVAIRRNITFRFSLNGSDIEGSVEIDDMDLIARLDRGKAFEFLVSVISKKIADEVISQAMSEFANGLSLDPTFKGGR